MRNRIWLTGLITALIILCAPLCLSAAKTGNRPVMHPDKATLESWVQSYNQSKRFTVDSKARAKSLKRSSLNLLNHLDYVPAEYDQGYCGNCWAWAGTSVLSIALDTQLGVHDGLSVQFINSCKTDYMPCDGGWLINLVDFYKQTSYAIPKSNRNANWLSYYGYPEVYCDDIGKDSRYPVNSISLVAIETQGIPQAQAISNIKAALNAGRAVWFAFFLPTDSRWNNFFNFWNNNNESTLWSPDITEEGEEWDSGGGGHAVACVGYNDEDPLNSYWIMLNSWGTASGMRPAGLFRVPMNIDYSRSSMFSGSPMKNLYWQTLDVSFGNLSHQPVANAGQDQTVIEGNTVTLDASSSADVDGGNLQLLWEQTSGRAVTLSGTSSLRPTFLTPAVGIDGDALAFRLTVTDDTGFSDTDYVTVTITDNGVTAFNEDVLPVLTAQGEYVGLKLYQESYVTFLSIIDPALAMPLSNMPQKTLYSEFDMVFKVDNPGDPATIILYFTQSAPVGYIWFAQDTYGNWLPLDSNALFNDSRDQLGITLFDGEEGDSDGLADGVVMLKGILAIPDEIPPADNNPPASEDSGGSGGCFITVAGK